MVAQGTIANQAEQQANQAVGGGVKQRVTQAIKMAAARTGVDFAYLMNKAGQESGLDPNAKASSSSATGLFQFTSQTWLQMVKAHGAQFGLGQYADQIEINNGVANVSDPTTKKAILALRKDPTVSAEMAGALDQDNLSSLKKSVGGKVGATELYLAHFLGAGGASDFLKTMKSSPNASAAEILPDAADANPSVFYSADGEPRSLSQIYQHFAQKFDKTPSDSSTMLASTAPMDSITSNSAGAIASNYAMSMMPNASMTMASLAGNTSSGASGNEMSPVGKYAPDASSMFATMVLAQMDAGDLTRFPVTGAVADGGHKKAAGHYASANIA